MIQGCPAVMSRRVLGTEEHDPRKAGREARAGRYFDHDLKVQPDGYSERASTHSQRAQWLGLFVIAAGASTAVVQALGPHAG
jgi:hypothetical protein